MFTESYNVTVGKDLGDHSALPPHFTDAGTETQGNEEAYPIHTAEARTQSS